MVSKVRTVVCLSLLLCVCQIRGSHIPVKMNKTITSLLQHFKIKPAERFNGKLVFSREPLAAKMEARKVFMGGVMETYEKLLGHMVQQQPTPSPDVISPTGGAAGDAEPGADVRTQLNYILRKVQQLRKERFHEQETVLQGLRGLKHIQQEEQMNNFVIQSKALWELPWLYEEASSMPVNRTQRRRRRQAWRVKTGLRA